MKRVFAVLLLGLILIPRAVPGQNTVPNTLEQVAPLIDELTVAVARLDLKNLDLDATFQTVSNLVSDGGTAPLAAAELEAMKATAKGWVARFVEAGGRDIYALFSLKDLGLDPPVIVVVPVAEGGDVEAMRNLAVSTHLGAKGDCAVMKRCVVVAPAVMLGRLEKQTGAPPRDLRRAFAQTPPGVMQAVFLPYEGAGRVVDELMPVLPAVMGGGSSAALSRGLRWATLSVTSPPRLSIQLAIQERTGSDAESLRRTILASLEGVGNLEAVGKEFPTWNRVKEVLTPTVQGDRVIVTLDRDRLETFLRTTLLPAMAAAKQRALTLRRVNDLKQIGLAVLMYANDHKEEPPAHLAAILPYLGSVSVLLGPGSGVKAPPDFENWDQPKQAAWLDQHGAYIYMKPGRSLKKIKNPAETLLAYPRSYGTGGPLLPAVFVDGAVQQYGREAFEKLLKAARE